MKENGVKDCVVERESWRMQTETSMTVNGVIMSLGVKEFTPPPQDSSTMADGTTENSQTMAV